MYDIYFRCQIGNRCYIVLYIYKEHGNALLKVSHMIYGKTKFREIWFSDEFPGWLVTVVVISSNYTTTLCLVCREHDDDDDDDDDDDNDNNNNSVSIYICLFFPPIHDEHITKTY